MGTADVRQACGIKTIKFLSSRVVHEVKILDIHHTCAGVLTAVASVIAAVRWTYRVAL